MKYNKDKWVETYKQTVKDLNTSQPTGSVPMAVASIRYLRDGLLADHTKQGTKQVVPITVDTIRESFRELIQELSAKTSVDDGFLSNASAAAKVAGFTSNVAKLNKLTD